MGSGTNIAFAGVLSLAAIAAQVHTHRNTDLTPRTLLCSPIPGKDAPTYVIDTGHPETTFRLIGALSSSDYFSKDFWNFRDTTSGEIKSLHRIVKEGSRKFFDDLGIEYVCTTTGPSTYKPATYSRNLT